MIIEKLNGMMQRINCEKTSEFINYLLLLPAQDAFLEALAFMCKL